MYRNGVNNKDNVTNDINYYTQNYSTNYRNYTQFIYVMYLK